MSEKGSKKQELNFKNKLNKKIDRREFLLKAQNTTIGIIGASVFAPLIACKKKEDDPSPPDTKKHPFKLGVASGDPWPESVVLWTRLAPEPLSPRGGMPSESVDVDWEVAEDQFFKKVVKQGTATADPRHAHSVHVEVEGLAPGSWYYYRFKTGDETSRIGRTKTAPAAGSDVDQLNFAFASCQSFPSGFYTCHKHLAKEDLDVLFFLGDYIYQSGSQGDIGRGHVPTHTIQTLTDYRIRYGQYKSDPLLQDAHAAFPWIVTFDDHEVKNNWAGNYATASDDSDTLAFQDLRANAFKAYYEHQPVRKSAIPQSADIQIYRRFKYGNLAEFNVLDTRQFRTNFACGTSHNADCPERLDPSRTILGAQQEQWLFDGLKQSTARWKILPQQVFMAQMDRKAGPGETFSMDKWDGYVATRNRLLDVVKQNNISNFVVLTGDIHQNFVTDLLEDFSDPNSQVLGSELVVTSISSGGNGSDFTSSEEEYLTENPWIKFANHQRGYVCCQLTPDRLKADYRVVTYVEKEDAPIQTRASFVIKNGQPGVVQVAGRVV